MSNYQYSFFGFLLFLVSTTVLSQSFEYQGTLCELESGKTLISPEAVELEKIRDEVKKSESEQFHTYFLETPTRDFKKNGITIRIRTKPNRKSVDKVTLKKTFLSVPIESTDPWKEVGKFKFEKNIYPDKEGYTYSVDIKPAITINEITSAKDVLGDSAQKLLKDLLPGWDSASSSVLFFGPIESTKIELEADVEIDLWQVGQDANAEASKKLSTESTIGFEQLASTLRSWALILCRESSSRTSKFIDLLEERKEFKIIKWK